MSSPSLRLFLREMAPCWLLAFRILTAPSFSQITQLLFAIGASSSLCTCSSHSSRSPACSQTEGCNLSEANCWELRQHALPTPRISRASAQTSTFHVPQGKLSSALLIGMGLVYQELGQCISNHCQSDMGETSHWGFLSFFLFKVFAIGVHVHAGERQ